MVIIPARLQSKRFKEKVIYPIAGIPMVVRVAKKAMEVDNVVVATDDQKIMNICQKYNVESILTSQKHLSGSDRVAEAADILGLSDKEVVINVQGDEPFIEPEVIFKVKQHFEPKSMFMSSAFRKISFEEANNPDMVKVVLNRDGYALYFSRSLIPFVRDDDLEQRYFGHIGIYAYRVDSLKKFCSFAPSVLEKKEKLEQLRVLYYGYPIGMVEVASRSFGIDTEDDLKKALNTFGLTKD